MKIYTKTGDAGETSLFGGDRVRKSSVRIEAYGTVDEINALVGLSMTSGVRDVIYDQLRAIQSDLFTLGADLATPLGNKNAKIERMPDSAVEQLEKWIDALESRLEPLRSFILPGGCLRAAYLHMCRTVCRRAERMVVALSESEEIHTTDILYLNRLSDYFFVAARYANYLEEVPDTRWKK